MNDQWAIMAYAFVAGLFLGGGIGLWIGLAVRPIHRVVAINREWDEKKPARKREGSMHVYREGEQA